jgi:transcriptional regulator with XRE-family HTH domain
MNWKKERERSDLARNLRCDRRMTQSEIARLTGMNQSKISRIERGQQPRSDELERILEVLTTYEED